MRIDAHQHFWNYLPEKHAWIDEEMKVIRRDFLPADLLTVLEANGIDGTVAVQADQTEAETEFLLSLAAEHSFIKGIVGWVDLRAPDLEERLDYFAQFPLIKGFRHILQAEPPEFMLNPSFTHGIELLGKYNFTYDILVFPHQLTAARQLVAQYPDQRFVIDHIAKPYIKKGLISEWKKDMQSIAAFDHVSCKISGMVTETDYNGWKKEDFIPYIETIAEAFGTNRILFGSDWPVCLVAAQYKQVLDIVSSSFTSFSAAEQAQFFGKNAVDFYGLSK